MVFPVEWEHDYNIHSAEKSFEWYKKVISTNGENLTED